MAQATGTPRLTTLSHGAGCACKLPLATLERLMATVGQGFGGAGGDLLVAAADGDDAAVGLALRRAIGRCLRRCDRATKIRRSRLRLGRHCALSLGHSPAKLPGARPPTYSLLGKISGEVRRCSVRECLS